MPSLKSSSRRVPLGSTVVILAAMAGLALAGCSHPANNTDNTADSTASAASDSSALATPAASDMSAAAPSSADSSMMSSTPAAPTNQ